MLRICFTSTDLRRVRVAAGPHPTWETVLSINDLQSTSLPARRWGWRDSVTATARRRPHDRLSLAAATALVPASGNFPDFLTPAVGDADVAAHYDAILSVGRDAVRGDLVRTFRRSTTPPRWARSLYRNGRTSGVVAVLRDYHRFAIEPVWLEVHRQVEIERARCARLLLDGGVDGLLGGLHPSIRWRPPVLEADYPVKLTVMLAGRGLTIVPASFCWGGPVTLIHTESEPILIFPADTDAAAVPGDPAGPDDRPARLAGLIGSTRARLLVHLAAVPATTTRLAALLAVTPAAVSQHTKVLRKAGLLTTSRTGASVQHALTPLGRQLLHDSTHTLAP